MFQEDIASQPQLFSFSYAELVPQDSDVWLYIDLFSQIDLSEFSDLYSKQGQEAKDPELMLRTIFYGLTHGAVSGRKLSDFCRYDNRFILLSGARRPDPRTFQRFLVRHDSQLKDLFANVVRLAQSMGLVSLGKIAIDGSKFRAPTSKHKAMSYGHMKKAVEQIQSELEKLKKSLAEENRKQTNEFSATLPEEIQKRERRLEKIKAAKAALEAEKGEAIRDKDQKSFNDHEALPMGGKNKEFGYVYNCQAAVDEKHQIIVAAEIHDSQNDAAAIGKMLDATKETCGKNPEQALADSGYGSYEDIRAVESRSVDPVIALAKGEHSGKETYADEIKAGNEENEFHCPAGKVLPIKTLHKDGMISFHLPDGFCDHCPFLSSCKVNSRAKSRIKNPLKIHNKEKHEKIRTHRQKMRTTEIIEVYKRRKAIVEPVFGNIKNKGIKILVKGKQKVSLWWKLAATAHNIEKMIKHLKIDPRMSASSSLATTVTSG
ncbi:MAG: IS1182 family transposase [Deltaproteobacteria bacterium]|nr:IS1182 family transposase [Deltaproteobacteria bacterium]